MADQTTDFLNFLNDQLNTRVASNEAIFQPTSDGFFTITDGLGKLTISIDGITNYADGTELKLEIVNLTSVTLISVHLDVSLSQANSKEWLPQRNHPMSAGNEENPAGHGRHYAWHPETQAGPPPKERPRTLNASCGSAKRPRGSPTQRHPDGYHPCSQQCRVA